MVRKDWSNRHAQVTKIPRQRGKYTGAPSVYDDPKSRARYGGPGGGKPKYDWDALLALGEHQDVEVPEERTPRSWINQIQRKADQFALRVTTLRVDPDSRTIDYRVQFDLF